MNAGRMIVAAVLSLATSTLWADAAATKTGNLVSNPLFKEVSEGTCAVAASQDGTFVIAEFDLAAWTNSMTSIKSARLVDDGLELKTASWRDVGIAADVPGALKLGLEDEVVLRARTTCPSTGRPAVTGRVTPQYEESKTAPVTEFRWIVDGKWHDYSVRPFGAAEGRTLKRIKLGLPPEGRDSGMVVISGISIRHHPLPVQFTVTTAAADGFARAGEPVELRVRVWNRGTSVARNVTLTPEELPSGVEWVSRPEAVAGIPPDGCANFRCKMSSEAVAEFVQRFTLAADSAKPVKVEVPVKIAAKPVVRKADYVPEPRPPKCAYDIAACYYPGWKLPEKWRKIEMACPERKPLLGWYDEKSPEAIDWQIKWFSEHGIGILMMDWYWIRGQISSDHWIHAFAKAKWRKYLRWAVMWCNESQKPNHSPEDCRNVVRYWIDNYFKMPEYYRIGGKPVVGIFVPEHFERDLGVQGTKDFLAEARRMAREAGYGGIHFIGYLHPVDDTGGVSPKRLRALGFDEVAIYNYYGHFGMCESPRRYAWSHAEATSREDWERRAASSDVPFWPMVGTGRDERPWLNHVEVYGRTAESFARMCREMRRFADGKGIRRIQLGPVNEWGEGSYIEPCVEHGFAMVDAVRDAFCEKPAEGWPGNVVPADLGLGPYDLDPGDPAPRADEVIDFKDGKLHGWAPLGSHVQPPEVTAEGLHVVAKTSTPGIVCDYVPFMAEEYPRLTVRLKTETTRGSFRVYWRSEESQWCEASGMAIRLVPDGDWHDYVFDLSFRPAWTQRIFAIRLQPDGKPGSSYVVSRIGFNRK